VSIDSTGRISLSPNYAFVTPIGTFDISASASYNLFPDKRTLTIRYDGQDTVYELDTDSEFEVTFDQDLYESVTFRQSSDGNLFLELRSIHAGEPPPPDQFNRYGPWRWDHVSDGASATVRDGRLEIQVKGTDTVRQYLAEGEWHDFAAAVSAHQTDGSRNSGYGLVFRHRDHRNCYRFTITGNGEFEFGKEEGNKWRAFPGFEGKVRHDCIKPAGSWNRLELVAEGQRLRASVNGCLVAEINDPAFASGHVGLLVGTEADGRSVSVAFDEFSLQRR
jgi:hypothetical protein